MDIDCIVWSKGYMGDWVYIISPIWTHNCDHRPKCILTTSQDDIECSILAQCDIIWPSPQELIAPTIIWSHNQKIESMTMKFLCLQWYDV